MRTSPASLAATVIFAAAPAAAAPPTSATVKKGEEVDVTSGAVTALSCALLARDEGKLDAVNACPYVEAQKGLVVYDVAEEQIYVLDAKRVPISALERAFGGGSVDFRGKVIKLGAQGVATVAVDAFSVTPKPKPGSSKACL